MNENNFFNQQVAAVTFTPLTLPAIQLSAIFADYSPNNPDPDEDLVHHQQGVATDPVAPSNTQSSGLNPSLGG